MGPPGQRHTGLRMGIDWLGAVPVPGASMRGWPLPHCQGHAPALMIASSLAEGRGMETRPGHTLGPLTSPPLLLLLLQEAQVWTPVPACSIPTVPGGHPPHASATLSCAPPPACASRTWPAAVTGMTGGKQTRGLQSSMDRGVAVADLACMPAGHLKDTSVQSATLLAPATRVVVPAGQAAQSRTLVEPGRGL